jgi:uncharacterized membrane protein YjfL (UPF0719 family)
MDTSFLEALFLTILACTVFTALLRLVQRLARRGSATVVDDNPAHRMYAALQTVGVAWIGASAAHHCAAGDSFGHDVLWVLAFGGLGFVLYVIAGQLGVRLLLGRRLAEEIHDDKNMAAAVAAGAHHIAVALLVAQSAAGTDLFGLALAVGFFVLGLLTHQAVMILFRALTRYDDAEQVAGENMAAALSYAGASIGAAIVLARALDGDFDGLAVSAFGFAEVSMLAVLALPVRLLVSRVALGSRTALDDAIALKHDTAAAALDAAVAIAVGFTLARLV